LKKTEDRKKKGIKRKEKDRVLKNQKVTDMGK